MGLNNFELAHNNNPTGELRAYVSGHVDEILTDAGVEFKLEDLAAAAGSAAVCVQTRDSKGYQRRYYLDAFHLVDPQSPSMVARLQSPYVAAGEYKIVIGQAWQSPLGQTSRVEAIILPCSSEVGTRIERTMILESRSATAVGRRAIDQAVNNVEGGLGYPTNTPTTPDADGAYLSIGPSPADIRRD
ncbi:MAG: hypothetical protein ABI602_00090 [Candidatus Saccharibacteria bacterium]